VTPLERLLLEAIPTRPASALKPAPKPAAEPWTPEEQAQHRADLDEALDGWTYGREQRRDGRHLWLVDTDDQAA
jgi:hypothetical protein